MYASSAEIYNPSTEVWTMTGNIGSKRYRYTVSLLSNGRVLVVGSENAGILNSAELYDSLTGLWTKTANMNYARVFHTASVLGNGKVLVIGGIGGNNGSFNRASLSSAELYDPSTGMWIMTDHMATERVWYTASVLTNETILVAGGLNRNGSLITTELYQWHDQN